MTRQLWGISSAGRALAWHARGQRFDPAILHQKSTVLRLKYGAFLFAFLEVALRISQLPDFAGGRITLLDVYGMRPKLNEMLI